MNLKHTTGKSFARILFLTVFCLFTAWNVKSQTNKETLEWFNESETRIEKILNLNKPENCGIDIIDNASSTCSEIIDVTVKVSPLVKKVYISSLGLDSTETADSCSKTSLEELYELGNEIFQLTEKLSKLVSSMTNITDIISSAKSMQAIKASSSIKYITGSMSSVGKELYFDILLLNELIKAKTGESDLLDKAKEMFSWL